MQHDVSNTRVRLVYALVILACWSTPTLCQTTEDVNATYLNFDIDTFRPIFAEHTDGEISIDEMYHAKFCVPEGDYRQALRDLIESAADGEFTDGLVRLKLTGLYEDPVFIDTQGGVRIGGLDGAQHKLSEVQFTYLRALVNAIARWNPCSD